LITRDNFYAYGEITNLVILPGKSCAFVTYSNREGAEKAVKALYNKLTVKGVPLRVSWGRSAPGDVHGGNDTLLLFKINKNT